MVSHAAVDDGLADVLDRDFFDGPECQALFALGASALDLVDGRQQQRDGVERRNRFDVILGRDPHVDASVMEAANCKLPRQLQICAFAVCGRTCRDQYFVVILTVANGDRTVRTSSQGVVDVAKLDRAVGTR
jgi:hypothetical protein